MQATYFIPASNKEDRTPIGVNYVWTHHHRVIHKKWHVPPSWCVPPRGHRKQNQTREVFPGSRNLMQTFPCCLETNTSNADNTHCVCKWETFQSNRTETTWRSETPLATIPADSARRRISVFPVHRCGRLRSRGHTDPKSRWTALARQKHNPTYILLADKCKKSFKTKDVWVWAGWLSLGPLVSATATITIAIRTIPRLLESFFADTLHPGNDVFCHFILVTRMRSSSEAPKESTIFQTKLRGITTEASQTDAESRLLNETAFLWTLHNV